MHTAHAHTCKHVFQQCHTKVTFYIPRFAYQTKKHVVVNRRQYLEGTYLESVCSAMAEVDSSPECFYEAVDWEALKAKEEELKCKEAAIQVKEREILEKSEKIEEEAKKLAFKEKLMSKEAALNLKEQELLKKDRKIDEEVVKRRIEKGEQSQISKDQLEQEVRDLKRIVNEWEHRERKRMIADEKARSEKVMEEQIRKKVWIEESERERVRVEMIQHRRSRKSKK